MKYTCKKCGLERFYENRLNLSMINNLGNVKLIEVNNVNQKGRNSSLEEAQEIVKYIVDNKLGDVFIITPFRNQEAVLNHYLQKAKEHGEIDATVNCGTIHKIQGRGIKPLSYRHRYPERLHQERMTG